MSVRHLAQLLVVLGLLEAAGGVAQATTPRPPAIAPAFHVVARQITLPQPCAQAATRRRVVALLRDFRSGKGAQFTAAFAAGAVFQPYNGTSLAAAPGGRGIRQFVRRRHAAGDVWTGTALMPPTSSSSRLAIYELGLQVLVAGRTYTQRAAKIVVRCDSGKLRAWVGPVIRRTAR